MWPLTYLIDLEGKVVGRIWLHFSNPHTHLLFDFYIYTNAVNNILNKIEPILCNFGKFVTFDLLNWPWRKSHRSNLITFLKSLYPHSYLTSLYTNAVNMILKKIRAILCNFGTKRVKINPLPTFLESPPYLILKDSYHT